MRKTVWILTVLLLGVFLTGTVQAPSTNAAVTIPAPVKTVQSPLNMTLLSATVNGCSQIANVNATWTGQSPFYPVSPGEFNLITRTRNMVYSNTTDLVNPNNTISTYYLFRNVPITLQLSFVSCTALSQEKLVYSDGTFTILLS